MPVPWGGLKYDVCGFCGGDDATCIGCDGIAQIPPKKFDVCMVCGGDGMSCLGCDGVPFSRSCKINK